MRTNHAAVALLPMLFACGPVDPGMSESDEGIYTGGETIPDEPVPNAPTHSTTCGRTITTGTELARALFVDDYRGEICIPSDKELRMQPSYRFDTDGDGVVEPREYTLPIRLRSGVTLRSGREGLTLGARIFIEATAPAKYSLFRVDGDDVRIEGLRIHGPSTSHDAPTSATGIEVFAVSATTSSTPGRVRSNIVIQENELSGWPHAAIKVFGQYAATPAQTMTSSESEEVLITRNYFHHNVMDGTGYGVHVGRGSYAQIRGNVFDYNRHAVSSDGKANGGYIARYNYVLAGGHCEERPWGCFYNQHFDVHGTGEGGDGGAGGEYFLISQNTIRGDQTYRVIMVRPAFQLRGEPEIGAYFHNNVLMHDNADDAVRIHENSIDNYSIAGNRYQLDTSNDLAVGDFDGDGRDDVFVANGTAWFYSSGGKTEWRYLKNSTTPIEQLGFGDFDGDHKTDVFTRSSDGRWYFSPSGSGAFVSLASSSAPFSELRFGDFNGDGKADVLRATGAHWYVSWAGTSTWDEVATSSYGADAIRLGDFDADGKTDVFSLANGQWSWSRSGQSAWARLNDQLSSDLQSLVFGDFNGDGRTDVAQRSGAYSWRFSASGRGAWQTLRSGGDQPMYADPTACVIGDFNRDGRDDAVRFELSPYATYENGQLVIKYMPGKSFWLWTPGTDSFVPHSRHGMR
jgi:hypothetical protein